MIIHLLIICLFLFQMIIRLHLFVKVMSSIQVQQFIQSSQPKIFQANLNPSQGFDFQFQGFRAMVSSFFWKIHELVEVPQIFIEVLIYDPYQHIPL